MFRRLLGSGGSPPSRMPSPDEEYGYSLMETAASRVDDENKDSDTESVVTQEEEEEESKSFGGGGLLLPRRPLKLEVESLSYYVRDARLKTEIVIMDGVSCAFYPGEMCAIMGPSGAGKTTLLNVLSSRASGRVEGRVLLNGTKATAAGFKTMANYVPQDDDMLTSLTPRTQLEYVARLRTRLGAADRDERVATLLRQMRLDKCADVPIVARDGSKGVSGGQRKRVSIAMELANEPSALMLDEPTSGLDSSMAFECVSALSRLARSPARSLNVVCTIHQPSVDSFFSFDELLLLSAGRVVYHGAPRGGRGYFTNQVQILQQEGDDYKNPAEVVLDAVSDAAPGLLADAWDAASETVDWHSPRRKLTAARFNGLSVSEAAAAAGKKKKGKKNGASATATGDNGENYADEKEDFTTTTKATKLQLSDDVSRALSAGFETAPKTAADDDSDDGDVAVKGGHCCDCCCLLCAFCDDNNKRRVRAWRRRRVLAALQRRETQKSSSSGTYYDDRNDAYPISRVAQFFVLLRRAATDHVRSKLRIQLTVALGVGLLYGLVFRNLENTQDQYDMRLSALFMAVIYNGMMCVSQTSILVPLEKRVLLREYQNGYYAVFPFFASAILVRFTFQALATTCWAIPFYFMAGLDPSLVRFATLLCAVYLLALIGLVYGFTIGTVAKSPQKAQQLLIPCIMPLIIFCGFLLQYDGVQIYFRPIWFASFFRYAFTILVVNEFKRGNFDNCDLTKDFCPLAAYEGSRDDSSLGGLGGIVGTSVVKRKFVITEILDFDQDAIPKYFYILIIYAACLATTAYYILRHQARRRYG